MFTVRVPGGESSGRVNRSIAKSYTPLVVKSAPPPACRHAPMNAGKHAIVRTAIPPP